MNMLQVITDLKVFVLLCIAHRLASMNISVFIRLAVSLIFSPIIFILLGQLQLITKAAKTLALLFIDSVSAILPSLGL